jgi:hypothetical protein
LKKLARNEHSSLVCFIASDEEKNVVQQDREQTRESELMGETYKTFFCK